MDCENCGIRIPRERIKTIPDTRVCAGCSTERRKTTAEVEVDGRSWDDMVRLVRTPNGER